MNSPAEQPARNTSPITDKAAGVITRIEELSYDLRVSEVMSHKLKVVQPDWLMVDVLELFRTARISGAPVVIPPPARPAPESPPEGAAHDATGRELPPADGAAAAEWAGGKLVGVVSMEDMIRALRKDDLQAPVRDYMATKLITARASDPVVEALKIFGGRGVGRLPVVDETGQLVGILTKGDITDGVLQALQKDYQTEEVRRYRASHLFQDIVSDRTSLILRYRIRAQDFGHGGNASSHLKRALLRLGADAQVARRCGIAVYEAEVNLIIHTTEGGLIRVEIEPRSINVRVIDNGPGIPDVELARKAGYSTATDAVREMGFGAGMGLVNIERCVDEMQLESTVGIGTRLTMRIDLPEEPLRSSADQPRESQ
jgi:anti-sigma regulatory factor (Ser/Thr protein kinase)/CBS domain-containing protein